MDKNEKNPANLLSDWDKKSSYIINEYKKLNVKDKSKLRKLIIFKYDIAENTLWQKLAGKLPFKRAEIEVISNLMIGIIKNHKII